MHSSAQCWRKASEQNFAQKRPALSQANFLVDDGLPDRITTGLPKTLLPLAAVLAIHDINVSNAQMADNTLCLHLSLLNQFFSIFQLYFTMTITSFTNERVLQLTELKTEPWADFTNLFCLLLSNSYRQIMVLPAIYTWLKLASSLTSISLKLVSSLPSINLSSK